jgi:formyltetrahydrofolate-dependent phosphoribosylglycinamide formyltransferase
MKKLIGLKKFNTAIFISGNGSNLLNLIKYSLKRRSIIRIKAVVSNDLGAKGLEHAKKYRIIKKVFKFKNKIDDENKILRLLKDKNINLICLAGFMKILSKNFIKKFKGKILNIHPSLLPKYKGLNTHFRAIKNREKFSGCTVHLVNAKLDSGQIILQKKIKIYKNDSPNSLAKRILKHEHKIYPKAIEKLTTNL